MRNLQILLVLATLSALGYSQKLENESKIPLLILASKEFVSSLPPLNEAEEIERFLVKNSIRYTAFDKSNFTIYVSHQVAPLNDCKMAAEWLENVTGSNAKAFSLATPEGQQLFQSLSRMMLTSGFDTNGVDNFMAIVPAITIEDPSGKTPPQYHSFVPKDLKLDPVTVSQNSDDEKVAAEFAKAKEQPNLFPMTTIATEYVVQDFGQLKKLAMQPEAMIAISEVLNDLGTQMQVYKQVLSEGRQNLIDQLFRDEFPDEEFNRGKQSFDKLPQRLQDLLMQKATNAPETLGFSNSNDAIAYLNSNPSLQLRLNFSIMTNLNSAQNPTAPPTRSIIQLIGGN